MYVDIRALSHSEKALSTYFLFLPGKTSAALPVRRRLTARERVPEKRQSVTMTC